VNFFKRYLEDRREDKEVEARGAAICDANLARIRAEDPDALDIFTTTFTAALTDRKARDRLTEQLAAYAQTKARAARLDLYEAVFAGL
jgi:hypothetical protein